MVRKSQCQDYLMHADHDQSVPEIPTQTVVSLRWLGPALVLLAGFYGTIGGIAWLIWGLFLPHR
jgi:hypothetical protein